MGFLDSLKSIFTGDGNGSDENGYWIYVRCHRCNEVIKTRIDLRNDLSPRDEGGYLVNKTLIGNQLCFERIEVTLTFDDSRRPVDQTIARGSFITAAEYAAAQRD